MSGSRLHHVGYVTASIAGSVDEYTKATGLVWDGRIIHDPLQMVSVAILGFRRRQFRDWSNWLSRRAAAHR